MNCTPTRVNITAYKLELNKFDFMKALTFTNYLFKKEDCEIYLKWSLMKYL